MGGVGVTEFRPSDRHWSRFPRSGLVAALALGPLLAGCASPSMPSFSSIVRPQQPRQPTLTPPPSRCRRISNVRPSTVRSGASTLTSSADRGEADRDQPALSGRHQQHGARMPRWRAGNMVSIKVGIQGRVILGPQGAPGTVDVPIRYAVVFDGVPQRTITTKLERISVTVPPDDPNVLFSHVVEGARIPDAHQDRRYRCLRGLYRVRSGRRAGNGPPEAAPDRPSRRAAR